MKRLSRFPLARGRLPQLWLWLGVLCVFGMLVARAVHAAPQALTSDQSRWDLGQGQMSYFRDPSGVLDVGGALAAYHEAQFTPLPRNLALGYTKDAVWVAWHLNRGRDVPAQWVLDIEPTTLDVVQLYVMDAGGAVSKALSGDGVPMSRRAMVHRGPAFPLNLPEGDVWLLLRVKTTSQMTVMPTLWSSPAFEQAKATESLYFGLYFGLLLSVFAYSFVSVVAVRDKVLYLYPPYLLCHVAFWLNFDGLLALYFLPENPVLVNQLLGGCLAVLSVMGNYLYATLLKVGREYPISRVLLGICYLSGLVSLVSLPFGAFAYFMPGLMVTTLLALPVLAPHAWRQIRHGGTEGRIFGFTYLIFGSLVVVSIAMNLSLLPANFWTQYASQLGQIFHAGGLLLGLHHRVRHIQREREDARARLREVSHDVQRERDLRREQEQLLHMIGHEVRTPIAIIASAVDSLKLIEEESLHLDPDKEKRYHRIDKAIKRMEMLMQLVGAEQKSRLEAPELPRFEELDFSDICADNLELMSDAGDRIQLQVPGHWRPQVNGDPSLLGFLMLNLYDNALKYALGHAAIRAVIRGRSENGRDGVVFSICNRARSLGPGMTERIFDKFVRVDEHHSQPGLGLGLYLARRIAHQHEGSLVALNRSTDEVCFELWLPLADATSGKSS